MEKDETLIKKVKCLCRKARLPMFLNKYGPKKHPLWMFYLAHLVYTRYARCWRKTARFMEEYYRVFLHWTQWRRAIAQWPQWVWAALAQASVGEESCELGAIDGTTMARSNPSQHYLRRIGSDGHTSRPIQEVVMIDVKKRKFLAWRIRATPRGEKCDVKYLLDKSPILPKGILMDKGFDSNPLHESIRERGIWSVAPVRKWCKRGRYRRQLRDCFDYGLYWQRNLVECLFSAVKRLFGVHIRARTWRAQRAEINSRFIAYNIKAIFNHYFLLSRNAGA